MSKKDLLLAEEENQIGVECLQNEDYENALIHWEKAYELGSVEAIYHIANLYYYGEGVEEDHVKAYDLFLECAKCDDGSRAVMESQFNLANAYFNGDGVAQDMNEAFKWYVKAADNGHVYSAINTTIGYFTGQVLEKDYDKAFHYASFLAENNVSLGQYVLGVLYSVGIACDKDIKKARYYLTLAADQGDENAKAALVNLPPEEEEEEEDIFSMFKNVVEVDDPSDVEDMTYVTLDNISEVLNDEEYDASLDDIDLSEMDEAKVMELADNGNRKAQYYIGVAYMQNELFDEGVKYLSKSSALEYPPALFYLGICYLEGYGVKQDAIVGFGHISKAAKLDNVEANKFLLEYYEKIGDEENASAIRNKLETL